MATDKTDDKTQIVPDDDFHGETLVPDSDSDPLVGRRIGNYQVLSVLGRGGFGSVYKAEDTKLGRNVALKFLNQAGEGFHNELFEREAKALGILSKHPNIVQIHTWDEFEGKNFFVLEYMESSVADLLKKYPKGMPPELAIRIIAECADALSFAHESEILHRDIKSPNILIESENSVAKIADFGLARICGVSNNTIEGAAIGSPAYMAPEQVRGQELTHLCDIYSLGVTFYELLCGQPPITGTSVLELLEKVRNDDRVPLRDRTPDLPEEIYAIIDKATAQEPVNRYASAKDFAEVLRGIDLEPNSAPTLVPEIDEDESMEIYVKNSTLPFLAAVGILLLLITGGVAYLFTMASGSGDDSVSNTESPASETPTTVEAIDITDDPETPPVVAESTSDPIEALPAESYRVEDGVPETVEPEPEEVAEVVDADNNGIVDVPAEQAPPEEPTLQETLKDEAIEAAVQGGRKLLDDFLGQSKGKGKGKGKKKK